MFVASDIWINSIETRGGISKGFFAIKGSVNTLIKTINTWKPDEINKLLYTNYLSLYGSEIKATLVKPDPESIPIISRTLP